MKRLEYKYLVHNSLVDSLRKDVLLHMNYDSYSKIRSDLQYTVRSVYFDTITMESYKEKDSGIRFRNKFRIRGYNEQNKSSIVFLEIKRKDMDYVSKDRAKLFFNDLDEFLSNNGLQILNTKLSDDEEKMRSAKNFYFYLQTKSLNPVVLITYEREAFECAYGSGLRITFDKNIRSKPASNCDSLFTENGLNIVNRDYFVLEVKYNLILPSWVRPLITKYMLTRQSVSKYVLSIDKNKIYKSYFS